MANLRPLDSWAWRLAIWGIPKYCQRRFNCWLLWNMFPTVTIGVFIPVSTLDEKMKMKDPIRSSHRFQYMEKHGDIQADLLGKTTSLLTVLESKYYAWEMVRWFCINGLSVWATLISSEYKLQTFYKWWDIQPHARHRITYLLFPRRNPKKHKARLPLCLCFSVLVWRPFSSSLPVCPALTCRLTTPGVSLPYCLWKGIVSFLFQTPWSVSILCI